MKPNELKQFLATAIAAGLPVLIKGAPGIGKSDIVAQAAQDAGADLVISHPVVSDPTDYKGLPYAKDGLAEFLPFGELRRIVEATSRTVFFLDDLGQAPPSVQAACMQLILARRVNGHIVSPHVTFVAATNRKQDKASVTGILEPVKSRFASIVELTADVQDWIAWALSAQVPIELIAFIRFRPALLHSFSPTTDLTNSPCPRTVTQCGKLMQAGLPATIEYEAYSGAAGEGFAAELMGFLKVWRNLPDPDAILMNPATADVPTDPATLYAVCGALTRKATVNNLDRLLTYTARLPKEYDVMTMQDIARTRPETTKTAAYVQWCSTNQHIIA